MTVLDRPTIRLNEAETTLAGLLREAGADAVAERLQTGGLPTRRVEDYHYTDLKALLRQVPDRLAGKAEATGRMAPDGAPRIVIVNGRLAGTDKLPEGVEVAAGAGGPSDGDLPAAINAALAPEAIEIKLSGTISTPVYVEFRTEGEAAVSAAHVRIDAADGASATLVEGFSGSFADHFASAATAVRLGEGAALTFVQIDGQGAGVRQIHHADFRLAAGANLRTLTVNTRAALGRVNVTARFDGAGAHADFTGLNLIEGEQHADITLNASHAVADTTSQELYKSVVRDRATAVFQGKIVVERGAQKTDAKMMAQGLLLSEGAQVQHKPELEIFADDVVCGHGATCGALDERSLFYLMSRGIPKRQAESMLIRAFLAELFDPIEDEALRGLLDEIVEDWLGAEAQAKAA